MIRNERDYFNTLNKLNIERSTPLSKQEVEKLDPRFASFLNSDELRYATAAQIPHLFPTQAPFVRNGIIASLPEKSLNSLRIGQLPYLTTKKLQQISSRYLKPFSEEIIRKREELEKKKEKLKIEIRSASRQSAFNSVFAKLLALFEEELHCDDQSLALLDLFFNACFDKEIVISDFVCGLYDTIRHKENKLIVTRVVQLISRKNVLYAMCNIDRLMLNPEEAEDRQVLVDIAYTCAKENAEMAMRLIQKLNFNPNKSEDTQALFDIACLCAENDAAATMLYVENLNFNPNKSEDRQALFDIAYLCFKKESWFTIDRIHKLGFNPDNSVHKQSLRKLFCLFAQQDATHVIEKINSIQLNLNDPDDKLALVEIVKLGAQQDALITLRNIDKLGFNPSDPNDKLTLVEITKLGVQQNASATLKNINKFGFNPSDPNDKLTLVEIAKLGAQQDASAVLQNIDKLGFNPNDPNNKPILVEIAKLSAQQDALWIIQNIDKVRLNVDDLRDRLIIIEIYKLCIKTDPVKSVEKIKEIKLIDICQINQLILEAAELSPFVLAYLDTNRDSLLQNILYLHIRNQKESLKKAQAYLLDWMRLQFLNGEWFSEVFNSIKGDHARLQLIYQLAGLLLLLKNRLSEEEFKQVLEGNVIKHLCLVRSPDLRWEAFSAVPRICNSQLLKAEHFSKLPLKLTQKYASDGTVIELACQLLEQQEVQTSELIKFLDEDLYKTFKDGKKIKTLAHFLFLLEKSPLNIATKDRCLRVMCEHSQKLVQAFMQKLHWLTINLEFEQFDDLERGLDIQKIADEAVKKRIGQIEMQDLSLKWQETFGESRNPKAICTYVSKISKLNDRSAMTCLNQYIEWVLKDTYLVERYNFEKNPHLQVVQNALPVWRHNLEKPVSYSGSIDPVHFDPKVWLMQKLLTDRHMGPDFDTAYPEIARKLGLKQVEDVKKESFTPNEAAFQNTIFDLLRADPLEIEKVIEILKALTAHIPKTIEFYNDVTGQMNLLSSSSFEESGLKVVFTDDPYHLLLCGSDVAESCQRVDGDPELNRGLLGYLMNGQTKLIAVVNHRKIIARALLRLLWDAKRRTPVLFLERIYGDSKYDHAILDLARQKANRMGLTLTRLSGTTPYDGDIFSLGGLAPYEYCDALRGVQNGSRFIISRPFEAS